jgi:hypothetical protein
LELEGLLPWPTLVPILNHLNPIHTQVFSEHNVNIFQCIFYKTLSWSTCRLFRKSTKYNENVANSFQCSYVTFHAICKRKTTVFYLTGFERLQCSHWPDLKDYNVLIDRIWNTTMFSLTGFERLQCSHWPDLKDYNVPIDRIWRGFPTINSIHHRPDDRGRKHLQNVDQFLQGYTTEDSHIHFAITWAGKIITAYLYYFQA